jgi:exopolysaccharide production protein ExoZ
MVEPTARLDFKDTKMLSFLIDIVRGIAILLVIMVHLRNTVREYEGFNFMYYNGQGLIVDFFKFGAAGVGLFFLISGFLLDFLYYKNMDLKKFAVKRVARIFPAWFLWHVIALVIAYFGLKWLFQDGTEMEYVYGSVQPVTSWETLAFFITSLFFLGWVNFNIWNTYIPGGWSIQSEVQHYVMFPVLNKIKTWHMLSGLLVLQMYGLTSGVTWSNQIVAAFITSPFWFITGIVISRFLRNHREGLKMFTPLEALLILLLTATTLTLNSSHISQLSTMLVVIVSLFLSILIYKNGFLTKTIVNIGKYSYGMYFNHFILVLPAGYAIAYVIKTYETYPLLTPMLVVAFLTVTVVSYFVAKIMYDFYEKKFLIKANQMFEK